MACAALWIVAGLLTAPWKSVTLGDGFLCLTDTSGAVECPGLASTPPPGPFARLVTNGRDVCGLREDGALFCWNDDAAPVQRPGRFLDVDLDADLACAVEAEGVVACQSLPWGPAPEVVRGDRGRPPRSREPPPPFPPGRYAKIRLSRDTACTVDAGGEIACADKWASPASGLTPYRQFPWGPFRDLDLVRGLCGLRPEGLLQCWGVTAPPGRYVAVRSGYRFHPDGTLERAEDVPPLPFEATLRYRDATYRPSGVAGLLMDGRLAVDAAVPESLVGPGVDVAVWGGGYCVVRRDGGIGCAGGKRVFLSPAPEPVAALAVAGQRVCVLGRGGAVDCAQPTRGDGSRDRYLGLGHFTAVDPSAGYALRADGSAMHLADPSNVLGRWRQVPRGRRGCGLLADGRIECVQVPICRGGRRQMQHGLWDGCFRDLPRGDFAQVSSTYTGMCALRKDRRIACATASERRPFGRGPKVAPPRPSPVRRMAPPRGPLTEVGLGDGFACGLESDGSARCWGEVPAKAVVPEGPFKVLDVDFLNTCGLRPDGSVVCW